MDTNKVENAPLRFLKNEWFWIGVVLLAVLIGALQDYQTLQALESGAMPLNAQQLDQGALFRKALRAQSYMFQRHPEQMPLPLSVYLLNLTLVLTGCVILATLVIVRIQRPLLRPVLPKPSQWGLWDVLKVSCLYVLGALLFSAIFRANRMVNPLAYPNGWYVEIFSRILLIGTIVSVVLEERGGRLADLGIRGNVLRNILIAVIAIVALQPVLFMIEAAIFYNPKVKVPLQLTLQMFYESKSVAVLSLASVTALIVAPISEELLFRSFLQPALERWFGVGLSIFLSAAFFATAHRDMFALAPTFVLGLALAYVFARTRSLVGPVCMHVLFNGLAILQILALRST